MKFKGAYLDIFSYDINRIHAVWSQFFTVQKNSPKKSTRIHLLKMSTRIHPFWKKVSTRTHFPLNWTVPNRYVRSNHCELYGLIDNFFFTPPSYLLGIPTYLHASENSLIQYTAQCQQVEQTEIFLTNGDKSCSVSC